MAGNGLKSRISLAVVPPLYTIITKMLFSTCRIKEFGRHHYDGLVDTNTPYIAAFWHYSLFYTMHRIEGKDWLAMVSASDDAEFVSRFLERLGLDTVRGSRNKGGLGALKEMVKCLKREKKKAAIVADGSQGPARHAQAGAVLLASRTGLPILPFAWGADRCWFFKSWDRTALPKPYARIAVYFGEPLVVPPGIRSKALEAYRLGLEKQLNDIYEKAWGQFGVGNH